MTKYIVFGLILIGFILVSGFSLKFKPAELLKKLIPKQKEKKDTIKELAARLNGTIKTSYFKRTRDEANAAMKKTGQAQKFAKTMRLSAILSAFGVIVSLLMRNVLLAPVLGIGLYFIPLWCTRFYVYRYAKYLNEELEVALSMVTTSYMRSNDILASVSENVPHMGGAVQRAFADFVNNVKSINPNVVYEIEQMKKRIDNPLFWSWCDLLILCQSDYTIKGALPPIVSKFSDRKAQQIENETNMMLPLKEAITMILIVVGCIPLLYLINTDWYFCLVNTFWGQTALSVTAVVVLVTINKSIQLSGPIEFKV